MQRRYAISHHELTLFPRHRYSNHDMGQVSVSLAIQLQSPSVNEIPSLELNFAIMAACIPTLRPLFRSFDSNKAGTLSSPSSWAALRSLLRFFTSRKTGPSDPSSRGFVKQSDDAQSRAFRADKDWGAGAQYGLTILEPSQGDSRSERSTQLLQDPATTRKTTEINFVA